MKKFRFASDLHLEFAYDDPNFLKPKDPQEVKDKAFADYADQLFPPHGDDKQTTLLLSGDICENWRAHTRYGGFFKRVSERFAEVIWIPGNHEYYGHKFSDYHDTRVAMNMSTEYSNVFYWNRNRTSYLTECGLNIHVLAATLWSDCDKGNPLSNFAVSNGLNDYKKITFADVEMDIYRKLRVNDTMAAHIRDRDYIVAQVNKFKTADPDCVVIVMTHHAPSFQSIPERYAGDVLSNAYASHLNFGLFTHGQPDVWIHGHLHDEVNYWINETNVISNPYGYIGHHLNEGYNPFATLTFGESIDPVSPV